VKLQEERQKNEESRVKNKSKGGIWDHLDAQTRRLGLAGTDRERYPVPTSSLSIKLILWFLSARNMEHFRIQKCVSDVKFESSANYGHHGIQMPTRVSSGLFRGSGWGDTNVSCQLKFWPFVS